MATIRYSRRGLLKASAAVAAAAVGSQAGGFAPSAQAQSRAPAAEPITPALIEAAKKEGKLAFYTAMDLAFAERLAKTFEAQVSRHRGARRALRRRAHLHPHRPGIRQQHPRGRRGQHRRPAHCIVWKRNGWLAPYMPEEVAKHFDGEILRSRRRCTSRRAILISPLAYNTNLVKKEEAPKSFADLLDPKWAGKMVKAHPAYSGTIMNATFQIARELGWEYFEKLAKQRVLQVQSATDPPKKIALGERAVMVDGAGYLVIRYKEDGQPVEIVYPEEGTPLATGPSAVFKAAPNPNAARLFQNWMHSREASSCWSTGPRQYSPHEQTVEKPGGLRKLSEIKLMKEDPEGVEKMAEEIKARYAQIFKV